MNMEFGDIKKDIKNQLTKFVSDNKMKTDSKQLIDFIINYAALNTESLLYKQQKEFEYYIHMHNLNWTDDRVIEFVNWYIKLHKLPFRYELENETILDSFKQGDDYKIWHTDENESWNSIKEG